MGLVLRQRFAPSRFAIAHRQASTCASRRAWSRQGRYCLPEGARATTIGSRLPDHPDGRLWRTGRAAAWRCASLRGLAALAHKQLIRDQRERRPRRDHPARYRRLGHRDVGGQARRTPGHQQCPGQEPASTTRARSQPAALSTPRRSCRLPIAASEQPPSQAARAAACRAASDRPAHSWPGSPEWTLAGPRSSPHSGGHWLRSCGPGSARA
jgi:hypothetical protein